MKTLDRGRRIALLTTLRPEARDVAEDLGAETLELRSLDAGEMSALADAMAGASKPDEGDLARIIALAEGVPFVLEQAIYAFAQAGSGGTEHLPSGVESVIHARLNTLRPSTKELCQILGVLGPEIEYDIAMRVARSSVPQFDEDLRELVELQLEPIRAGHLQRRQDRVSPRHPERRMREHAAEGAAPGDPRLRGRGDQ